MVRNCRKAARFESVHFWARVPAVYLTSALEDPPHEMGEQGEQQEHEGADPDQESGGELRGFDLFLVHGMRIRLGQGRVRGTEKGRDG
jgi:hypothetical protein